MLEDLLELILITYNRDSYLDKTLEQLLDSPFKNCKITILDNCSPDNTPEICKKYVGKFPNMIIKRHNINIGGNANNNEEEELIHNAINAEKNKLKQHLIKN